jgi:hypothetical protein
VAALVVFQIPAGIIIANEWGGSVQERLYDLHKSVGAVLLPLVLARLIYHLTHPPLPLPADIHPLQQSAAHTTHWTLYALLIVQPVVGLIATSAYPAPIPIFGLFDLPPVWPEGPCALGAAVRPAPLAGDRPGRGRGNAYRCGAAPPFRAPGSGSHAHGHGMIRSRTRTFESKLCSVGCTLGIPFLTR